jgi:hypothetical protein
MLRKQSTHRIFYATRYSRTLDKLGYVRLRRWRMDGEHGLARRRAAVWLFGRTLVPKVTDELLSQCGAAHETDRRYLRDVVSDNCSRPRIAPHSCRSGSSVTING